MKRELLRGFHVVLRSNPISNPSTHPSPTSSFATSSTSSSALSSSLPQSAIDLFSQDDNIRENKQILRSIFMSCLSFTSQDIIPSIDERIIDGNLIYEIIMIPKNQLTS